MMRVRLRDEEMLVWREVTRVEVDKDDKEDAIFPIYEFLSSHTVCARMTFCACTVRVSCVYDVTLCACDRV